MDNIERITEPTRFTRVWIPDNSMQLTDGVRKWSPLFKKTIETMKKNASQSEKAYDRIYLSRAALKSNKDFGEERIESLFSEMGYTVIHPESLSIDQQISIMANCKSVVATDGSIAHNAIFCNSSADVNILLKADFVNGYQMMINNMTGYNVTYINAHHTIKRRKSPWKGPFYLFPTKELYRFLGVSRKPDLFWLRKDWYRYLYRRFFRR